MSNAKVDSAITMALGAMDYSEAVLTSGCWDYKNGKRIQGEMVVDAIGPNGKNTKKKVPAVDAQGNALYVPLSVMVIRRASVGRMQSDDPKLNGMWFTFMATKPFSMFSAEQQEVIRKNTKALQLKKQGGGGKALDGNEFNLDSETVEEAE
jgi:hypothetical protein